MRALMILMAAVTCFIATPAFAQMDEEMELQRCIWQCLARSSGNNDPAYHACVERVCIAARRQTAAPPAASDQSAERPDRNTITLVQQRLAALGFDPGPVDGVYGRKTAAAIQAFLADRGLPPETGISDALIAALDAAEASAPAATASPQEARELLTRIYTLPDPDVGILDKERRSQYFSPRLIRLIEAVEREYQRRYGLPELDFNPIVPGQDWDLVDLSISSPELDGQRAIVTVRFINRISNPEHPYELRYELIRVGDSWLIDEITTDGSAFSAALEAAAAPDEQDRSSLPADSFGFRAAALTSYEALGLR